MAFPEALTDLRDFLGDRLSTAGPVLQQHSQSESHIRSPAPDAVAFPQDSAEVARIAAICARHAVPIVGWGAGTSLEGHTLAVKGGLTVDFRLMNKVLAVYPEDMLAVVQPGILRERLNEELRDTGLFFPVDPGANASLSGMGKLYLMGAEHGPAWAVMGQIKRALDPHNLMNPGKLVPQK